MNPSGNLNDLLANDPAARQYFLSLPDYIQGMMQQRTERIHTMEELHSYAENLLAGYR